MTAQVAYAKQTSFKTLIAQFLTIISILLIIAGTIGILLVQKPLKESQDLRKDASVETGQVTVSADPSSGSEFSLNQASTITLNVDTQGFQVNGVELLFNMITETLDDPPSVQVLTSSGLEATAQEVQQATDGYLVSIKTEPSTVGQPFSTTSVTPFVTLTFTPTTTGSIALNFDSEESLALAYDSTTSADVLQHIPALEYNVIDDSVEDDIDEDDEDSDDNGTGGATLKQCNEVCESNDECEVNHRCYEDRCRLVTNVSSETCEDPGDQGLSFGCNEYCANTGECTEGYTCLENNCRRPDNPDDPYCQAPSRQLATNMVRGCNQSCVSNRDCAVNLRCYYNSCRLATNPSSTSCSAATSNSVSNRYSKKGDILDDETGSPSGQTKPLSSPQVRPSASPTTTDMVEDEQTALDTLLNMLKDKGLPPVSLPLVALGAGGALLLIIILSKLFKKKAPPTPTPVARPADRKHEQQLQSRLKELQNTPPPSTLVTQPPVTKPMPTTPRPVTPRPAPPRPPVAASTTQSSMLGRVKAKGIKPPTTSE